MCVCGGGREKEKDPFSNSALELKVWESAPMDFSGTLHFFLLLKTKAEILGYKSSQGKTVSL